MIFIINRYYSWIEEPYLEKWRNYDSCGTMTREYHRGRESEVLAHRKEGMH
jgi:hypothetical protein